AEKDVYKVIEGADAVVMMTAHREFRDQSHASGGRVQHFGWTILVDLRRVKERMRTPIVIDGRRVFEQSEVRGLGFVYRGVGAGNKS
ncbi:MAG: hypothetical protein Q8O41_06885, partial [Candidatus Methanoperedens sp.]|nr:hypothetical protein [Candidatus Methanoperedens sp.]